MDPIIPFLSSAYCIHLDRYVMLCPISLSTSEQLDKGRTSSTYLDLAVVTMDETFGLTSVCEKFTFHTVGVVVLK